MIDKPQPPPPLENSYWVEPGRFLAGEYPGGPSEQASRTRLRKLVDAGVTCFIDLTMPQEQEPYERWLPGPYGRDAVSYSRKPMTDHGLPERPEQTLEVLDEIDEALSQGRLVYLHCRAGIGRTNLVVGCWLARHGLVGEAALVHLNELWQSSARSRTWPSVPETTAQADYVRGWREPERAAARPAGDAAAALSLNDRYRGLLLGLAIGDACGQPATQRRPGTFTQLGDLQGGGPFDLPRGAWGDKTAMALCLAESLVETNRADPADQVNRYLRWQREGHLASTGRCVGISAETAKALAQAVWTRQPFAGSHDPAKAHKEPLARIGPAVAMFLADPERAIQAAVDAARVTHQAPITLDAVRYLAGLLVGALQGAPKADLTRPLFSPIEGYWDRHLLKPEVDAVARGSWQDKQASRIYGGGMAVAALEASLFCFKRGHSYRESVLAAANLGADADATAAITGQLAGAHHGASGIPEAWRNVVAAGTTVTSLADRLLERALARIAS